jgi:PilZ domain
MKKDKTPPKTTQKPFGTDELFERGFRKMSNKEARIFARFPCSEDTHFSANRELFEGTIKNVSEGGIYVQTRQRFVVGQEVVVAGPFGENSQDVKRYGKVVWYDDSGIAVQFVRRVVPTPRR